VQATDIDIRPITLILNHSSGLLQQLTYLFGLIAFLGLEGAVGASAAPIPDAYNVVWDSPGRNAADSMPCGGGDIGLNVWVEDGEVLFYIQRSGSLAETNEYLKLGRVRLQLEPNPFAGENLRFRQELKLREGYVEIQGDSTDPDGEALNATVRIWAEVHRPVIHLEVESSREITATASYESWRLEDEMIPNNNRRRSFFTLDGYPGEIKLSRDLVAHTADGVLFYHRNPGEGTVVETLIRQQGLEDFRGEITDPKDMVQSWHQDGIFFARMGLIAEAADFNTRKLVGALHLNLAGEIKQGSLRTVLHDAEIRGSLETDSGTVFFRALIHAKQPLAMIETTTQGTEAASWSFAAPASFLSVPDAWIEGYSLDSIV